MNIILNSTNGVTNFQDALSELTRGADTLSVGVSYLQVAGWQILRREANCRCLKRMRILCTDQMNITHPEAVRQAISNGVQVHNFKGAKTYHPKVIIAHDTMGHPIRFLLGSANLSYSAFTTSVEAGVMGTDAKALIGLHNWFNDLFSNQSEQVTPERLCAMEENWRQAAANRVQTSLRSRRGLVTPPQIQQSPIIEVGDIEILEDIFATIQLPIGLLNFDYARNNIRNVNRARNVLANWKEISVSPDETAAKQRSELKLLGFANGSHLTVLGKAAEVAPNDEAVARLWCKWLQHTSDQQLYAINPNLLVAKRVFPQFWRLQPEVRDYFLTNAVNPKERRILQTIELLCNTREVVQELSLDDIRALNALLDQPLRLPPHIRHEIIDYFDNKGVRSWRSPDRLIMPSAWRDVSNDGTV